MDRAVTFENIRYGMFVEVLHENDSYHSGCKVHFFNKKGVLVGNYYEFLPYERLRLRDLYEGRNRDYKRFFYKSRFEGVKMALFKVALTMTSILLRFTQRYMD